MGGGPRVIYDVQGDIRIPNDMPVLLHDHVKGQLDKGKIGIRRVLGASSTSIVGLLSKELMILVGLASLLSWPVGYLIALGWLQKYAYRIGLSGSIFVTASSFVLLFTFTTMAFQSVRAVRIDPIDCLRYE